MEATNTDTPYLPYEEAARYCNVERSASTEP